MECIAFSLFCVWCIDSWYWVCGKCKRRDNNEAKTISYVFTQPANEMREFFVVLFRIEWIVSCLHYSASLCIYVEQHGKRRLSVCSIGFIVLIQHASMCYVYVIFLFTNLFEPKLKVYFFCKYRDRFFAVRLLNDLDVLDFSADLD